MSNKTGQMVVETKFGNLLSNAKTGAISFNSIMDIGNELRVLKGKTPKELDKFWNNQDTDEFMEALVKSENLIPQNFTELENIDYKDILTITTRGRYGGTYGHLLLGIKLATWLDKDFEVEIYKTFIEKQILEKRVEGISSHKDLMDTIKEWCDNRGCPALYQNVNYNINVAVNGSFIKGWDHSKAIAEKQEIRTKIIDRANEKIQMDDYRHEADLVEDILKYGKLLRKKAGLV